MGNVNMTASQAIPPPEQHQYRRFRNVIACAGAKVHVRARSIATVLAIDGGIDACNADCFIEAIRRYSRLHAPLVVDLSHADFIGVAGFRALLIINDEHQETDLPWKLV